jgi:diguanylate cyclase (GGDEF)-like protein/PAS domain S-box-containing protein
MLLPGFAYMTPAHAASAGATTLSEPVNLVLAVLLTALIATLTLVLLILQRQRRMRSDRRLGEQAALLSNLITDLPEMVFYKDRRGVYRLCNKLGSEFLGRPYSEVIGKTDVDFFDRLTAETLRLHDDEATERESITQNEEWLTDADGKSVLLDVRRQPLVSEKGHRNGVLITCRDITESKQIQRELEYQARHDSLTGLANRYLLQEQLSFALQMARRNEESLAVIFIDLDRFKDINDAIGHTIGDLLLRDVAHRLRTNLRDSDICARLSGDEFVIVLTQTDGAHITEKCDQLLAELALPYQLQGHLLSIFASAGIAIAPEHGNNTAILLAHADAALHQAKALGRNRSCVYTPELTLNQNNQLSLEQDLRQAVLNEEFTLVFQPQFRVDETTPRRAETLIRWPHEFRGLISPHEFIPLAETTGLVKELGLWVIREAAKQFLAWREAGLEMDKIAVNVSAIQINANFADSVATILSDLNFDPTWLELEVTESLMMSGMTEISTQIQQLCELGVEFSIDDFGTGYSSLSKLKSMPVSVLKIDRSFVRNIHEQANDYEIARAIIMMALSLGLSVVAEGVESKEQEQTLRNLGCEWMQGFMYGMPMKGTEFLQQFGPKTSSEPID